MNSGAPELHFGVIPARSGSKGLAHKNILELDGRPVLAYSIEAARKSGLFRDVFVATDDPRYADLAREWGAAVPFLLSPEVAGDAVSSTDALLYVWEREGRGEDLLWCLQPTSPFRLPEDLLGARELFSRFPDTACVVSGTPVDPHFFHWVLRPEENHRCGMWFGEEFLKDRSLLPPVFRPNGMIKVGRREVVASRRHFFVDPLRMLETPEERSIHIRSALDLALCRMLVREGGSHAFR